MQKAKNNTQKLMADSDTNTIDIYGLFTVNRDWQLDILSYAIEDIESNYWNDSLLCDGIDNKSFSLNLVTLASWSDEETAMKEAIFKSIENLCNTGRLTSPIFMGI